MDVTETPPIVVTTAEAWTPLENAERSGDGERDWFRFDELMDRSTTRGEGGESAVRRSARERRGRRTGDASSDEDDDDATTDEDDDDDDDENRRDPAYEDVGAKLLFIHSCAVFARDARVRLRALASWRAIGGADAKRATSLARNALLYRFAPGRRPHGWTQKDVFHQNGRVGVFGGGTPGAQRDEGEDASFTSAEYYRAADDGAAAKKGVDRRRGGAPSRARRRSRPPSPAPRTAASSR